MAKPCREVLVQRHKKAKANARAIKAETRTVWQRWLKRFNKAKRKTAAARAKVTDAGFQAPSESELSSLSDFGASSSDESSSSCSADEAAIDAAVPAPEAKATTSPAPREPLAPPAKAKAKSSPAHPPKAIVPKPPPLRKPRAAPVPKAPNSKRVQNAEGIFYPGFSDRNHPKYCAACDQLLRGFERATATHKPTCEWRQRKVPAKGQSAA